MSVPNPNLVDTPAYDDSIFDEPVSDDETSEAVDVEVEGEPVETEETATTEEGELEAEQQEETDTQEETDRKFANKYKSEDELVKGYTNLVNVYRDRVEQLAKVTGDDSYLDMLNGVKKEFETVEELEESYRQLKNDYQRQARTLNVLKGKKQAPAQQQPVQQQYNPNQQQQVIPPALAANPQFMNLISTNPLQAVEQIVQFRIQEAVQQRELTYQQELMQRDQQAQLMMQVGEIKQRPDFEELRDDIIETLEELPVLAKQPNGLSQAYEYAKLKRMRRELSENSVTAQQIKITNKEQKKKASAPVSGSSKTAPARTPDEEIIQEMMGQNKGLSDFLR
jgi:hypothetical protein